MPTPQRSGIRIIITLLLIAALAAVVWKLYVVDDANTSNADGNAKNANDTAAQNTNGTASNAVNTNSNTNEGEVTSNTNSANSSVTSSRTKAEQIEKNGFYLEDLPQPTVSGDGANAQEAFLYNDTDAISAVDPDTESIIRGSYGVTSEEEITIDGVKGKRLKGTSPKDGAVVEYILIANGEKLIFARGTTTFLDQLIDTLELD